jgi:hypothetical protein
VWAAYSTDITIVAREMRRLGVDFDYALSTVFLGQPTLEFENPHFLSSRVQPFEWIPQVPSPAPGRTAYFLDNTKDGFYAWLQQLYPRASFRRYTAPVPNAPPVLYQVTVADEDVVALQGVDAVYTPDGGQPVTRRERAIDFDWTGETPAPLPFDAVWTGWLEFTDYALHTLVLETPGQARLFLDGELLAEGSERIVVGGAFFRGEHELRIETRVERPGRTSLSLDDAVVSPAAYFSYDLAGHGLMGSFFGSEDWSGPPSLVQLDPLVGFRYHGDLSIGIPFSAKWEGFVEIPFSGPYRFQLEAFEESTLLIDGQPVVTESVQLTSGRHPIEVRFRNSKGSPTVFLFWQPPFAAEREILPPERLSPR